MPSKPKESKAISQDISIDDELELVDLQKVEAEQIATAVEQADPVVQQKIRELEQELEQAASHKKSNEKAQQTIKDLQGQLAKAIEENNKREAEFKREQENAAMEFNTIWARARSSEERSSKIEKWLDDAKKQQQRENEEKTALLIQVDAAIYSLEQAEQKLAQLEMDTARQILQITSLEDKVETLKEELVTVATTPAASLPPLPQNQPLNVLRTPLEIMTEALPIVRVVRDESLPPSARFHYETETLDSATELQDPGVSFHYDSHVEKVMKNITPTDQEVSFHLDPKTQKAMQSLLGSFSKTPQTNIPYQSQNMYKIRFFDGRKLNSAGTHLCFKNRM